MVYEYDQEVDVYHLLVVMQHPNGTFEWLDGDGIWLPRCAVEGTFNVIGRSTGGKPTSDPARYLGAFSFVTFTISSFMGKLRSLVPYVPRPSHLTPWRAVARPPPSKSYTI